MRLFDFLLSGISNVGELYCRESGKCELCAAENGAPFFKMKKNAAVDLNTYFNAFSYTKYLEHTTVEKLKIRLELKGKFQVRVMRSFLKNPTDEKYFKTVLKEDAVSEKLSDVKLDALVQTETLREFDVVSDARETRYFEFDLTSLDGKDGILFVGLTAKNDECEFYGGGYETDVESEKQVKIGMVICTYKREKYVKDNLERIRRFFETDPSYKNSFKVFVIDNGRTLAAEDFADCGGFAELLPNKNVGGSGGFTRGIIEVKNRQSEGFTHFLLTDDDISFETEILKKTLNILKTAKRPETLCVGAGMFRNDREDFQYEMGAAWDGDKVRNLHGGFELSQIPVLVKNAETVKADYSAWWYMCMPLTTVEKNGLPLPLFIKGDDMEYGLRSIEELMLDNGIGVWHEPFENKYSAELEYYIIRNEFILNCLHGRKALKQSLKKLFKSVARQVFYQRYFALYFVYKAYADVLKGADFLLSTDAEALHTELRKHNVKQIEKNELEKQGYDVSAFTVAENSSAFKKAVTLNGYIVPTCFYKKQDREAYRVVNSLCPTPKKFYMAKKVVQYNPVGKVGFVTELKRAELFKAGAKLLSVSLKLIFGYGKAKKSFDNGFNELTSRENWNKILFGKESL